MKTDQSRWRRRNQSDESGPGVPPSVPVILSIAGALVLGGVIQHFREPAPEPAPFVPASFTIAQTAAPQDSAAPASCVHRSKAGSPKPGKKPVVDLILAGKQKTAMLSLDARRPGVVVPERFRTLPNLVLEVGYDMPVPIPDLRVDDDGVTGTLSFNHTPFHIVVPWSAVYAVTGKDSQGVVWDADAPVELLCKE